PAPIAGGDTEGVLVGRSQYGHGVLGIHGGVGTDPGQSFLVDDCDVSSEADSCGLGADADRAGHTEDLGVVGCEHIHILTNIWRSAASVDLRPVVDEPLGMFIQYHHHSGALNTRRLAASGTSGDGQEV